MPTKRKQQVVNGQFFAWLVGPRKEVGVYYADGRSNKVNIGRHSLGTKDHQVALEELRDLDLKMAVKHGLADPSLLNKGSVSMLPLDQGIELYMDHVKRPKVMRGASAKTVQRYQAVFDKFKKYAATQGVQYWEQVNKRVVEGYGRWLHSEDYAYATEYLELTTIKQAVNWLIGEKHLPESNKFRLPLAAAEGTTTYCYRDAEVTAMIEHCFAQPKLKWLGQVIVGLVYTGVRIQELAQLRWPAVDLEANMLRVVDNTRMTLRRNNRVEVATKTHASRSLPIHPELRRVLDGLDRHPDGRVFHGPTNKVLKPDVVRNVLIREVLTPLKVKFPGEPGHASFADGRLHSCRHYFCSKCARDGVPEQTVMLWLGHRDSKMVRHYYHLHDDDAQRQMSKLKSVGGAGAA